MQATPDAVRPVRQAPVAVPPSHVPDMSLEERARVLAAQMALGHRVTMAGLESVAAWADGLHRRTDLSVAGIVNHTELIGRLGNTMSRMMTSVQRAVAMLERVDAAVARRASDRRAAARTDA